MRGQRGTASTPDCTDFALKLHSVRGHPQVHQIVKPSNTFIIGNNLPPGWEQAFSVSPQGTKVPYFVNKVDNTSCWRMPPDVLEQCNLTKLSKYPRCLPDHGFWAALKLWTFYLGSHAPISDMPWAAETKHLAGPPPAAPYWCALGAVTEHNGRTSTVLDLCILSWNLLQGACWDSPRLGEWLSAVLLPAVKQALARNSFFTGVAIAAAEGNTPARSAGEKWVRVDACLRGCWCRVADFQES